MKQQRGVTLIGLLFFFAILGFFLYAAARIVPSYMDYLSVQNLLEDISSQADIKDLKDSEIRLHFARSLNTNYVDVVNEHDLEIERIPTGVHLSISYSVKKPFMGPVSLWMDYKADASSK